MYGTSVQSFGALTELSGAPANLVPAGFSTDNKFEMEASATKYWAVAGGGNGKWFGVTNGRTIPVEVTTPGATDVTALAAFKTQSP